MRKSNKEMRNKFTILPGSWIVDEGGNQDLATREDIMDVLADIKVNGRNDVYWRIGFYEKVFRRRRYL